MAEEEMAMLSENDDSFIIDFDDYEKGIIADNSWPSYYNDVEVLFDSDDEEPSILSISLNELKNRLQTETVYATNTTLISETAIHEQKKTALKEKLLNILTETTTDENNSNNNPKIFTIRSQNWNNCVYENGIIKLKPIGEAKNSIIKSNKSNSSYHIIRYLLNKMYLLLMNNMTCTQRQIYYELSHIINSVERVMSAINGISCMLDVEPWYLPITSCSKGLVYGYLEILMEGEDSIQCDKSGGILIPQNVTSIVNFKTSADYILITEKYTVFKKIVEEICMNKIKEKFVLVTGKGYPDIWCRLFLKKLHTILQKPIFILVDSNPYGLEIMCTYKYGSMTMAHLSEHLALPSLKWLGIHPSDILMLDIVCKPLNENDKQKIKNILTRPYIVRGCPLQQQLEFLLKNNVKAEIEGLLKNHQFLTNYYIISKLYYQEYL